MSSIMQRSVRSFSWSAGAQVVVVGIGFARSVLLARLLNVETFGIYAGATAIVGLLAIPFGLGMGGAFLHRSPETANEDRAAAVFLAMQAVLTACWLILMTLGAFTFSTGDTRVAVLVIAWTTGIEQLTAPASALITRRVVLRRFAEIQIIQTIFSAGIAVALAWYGVELWALLSTEVVTSLILFGGLYIWHPMWKPHLLIERKTVVYFARFGVPLMLSAMAETFLQKIDDLYVRYVLGVREMGFYSRAYTFAGYPRAVLAGPITSVTWGAFAELVDDRTRLSKAFFRTAALLVRSSCLLGGLLIVAAPEIVLLLLGVKWMPMVPLFRLFAIFTLIDPLRDVVSSIYVALGLPRLLLRYRLAQVGVLVAGLLLLGQRWGTEGVAVAVNIALGVGIALMFHSIRPFVDYSLRKLFVPPILAATLGGLALWLIDEGGYWPESNWMRAAIKMALFGTFYLGALYIIEGRDLIEMAKVMLVQLRNKRSSSTSTGVGANLALATEEQVAELVGQPLAIGYDVDPENPGSGKG